MGNQSSMTQWQQLFFSYNAFLFSAAIAIATFEYMAVSLQVTLF